MERVAAVGLAVMMLARNGTGTGEVRLKKRREVRELLWLFVLDGGVEEAEEGLALIELAKAGGEAVMLLLAIELGKEGGEVVVGSFAAEVVRERDRRREQRRNGVRIMVYGIWCMNCHHL